MPAVVGSMVALAHEPGRSCKSPMEQILGLGGAVVAAGAALIELATGVVRGQMAEDMMPSMEVHEAELVVAHVADLGEGGIASIAVVAREVVVEHVQLAGTTAVAAAEGIDTGTAHEVGKTAASIEVLVD